MHMVGVHFLLLASMFSIRICIYTNVSEEEYIPGMVFRLLPVLKMYRECIRGIHLALHYLVFFSFFFSSWTTYFFVLMMGRGWWIGGWDVGMGKEGMIPVSQEWKGDIIQYTLLMSVAGWFFNGSS